MESNGTTTKQKELLSEQLSTEENNSSSNNSSLGNKLIDREQVGTTPFQIVTTDRGHFLSMGTYVLSETMQSKQEVKEWLRLNKWQLTLTLIQIAIDVNLKLSQSTGNSPISSRK